MICTEPLMHFVTKSNHCLALKSWKDCRGKTNREKRAPCVHKQRHNEGVGIGGQTIPWAGRAGSSCEEGHSAGARGHWALMVAAASAATAPQGHTWDYQYYAQGGEGMLRGLIHVFLISLGGNGMYLTLYSTLGGEHSPTYRSVLPPAMPSNFISPSHPASWAAGSAAMALQLRFQTQWKND